VVALPQAISEASDVKAKQQRLESDWILRDPNRKEMEPPREVGLHHRGYLHMAVLRGGVGIKEALEEGTATANDLSHKGQFTNQSLKFGKRHRLPRKEILEDDQNGVDPSGGKLKLS
jgi:hypothetical protein